ncbi:MAG: VWA domain-containing protein [Acidimicrobiales bacterium]|nr:VWA domain-containing protein [Acidimicrobiales bacterium]
MTHLRLAPTLAPEPDADAGLGALTTEVPGLDNLALEALDVTVAAHGLLADTTVVQRFRNHHDRAIEVTYVFPLPARAAVVSFTARLGDRVVTGVLKERGEARADYDRALAQGRRAAIVEEERPEVFTCRVGNIGAGETAEVTLALVAPLPHEDGGVTVRVPLVVAPRYVPGTPLDGESVGAGWGPDTDAAPDGSRVTPPVLLPGFPEPIALSLAVTVDPAGLPLGELASSLHAVTRTTGDDGAVRVEVDPGERVDRDFVLRYDLAVTEVEAAATVSPDPADVDAEADADADAATVSITVVGPPPTGDVTPRDVVVLLDRSGSMGGWKIVAARRAAGRLVDALGPGDRFALLAFDHECEAFGDGTLTDATDRNRWRAGEWAARLDARGGTELLDPLQRAVALLDRTADEPAGADRERIVLLVTDGQVANEGQLVATVADRPVRLFSVGIDRAVNAGLLERLARTTGGRADLVESEDRLDEALAGLRRRLAPPLLSDLTIDGPGIDPTSLASVTGLDLHEGVPLVAHARRASGATGAVTVRARRRDGSAWTRVLTLTPGPASARSLWGKARLRDLEDRYEAHGGDTRPIVDLSLTTGVLCRFTAFVAESPDGPVDADGAPLTIVQPVSFPSGWSPDALGIAPAMAAPASFAMAPPPPMAVGPADDAYYGLGPDDGAQGILAPQQWHQQEQAAPSRPGLRIPGKGVVRPAGGRARPPRAARPGPFWSQRPAGTPSTPPADGSLASRVRDLLRAVEHPAADLATLAVRARALAAEARGAADDCLARALDDLAVVLDAGDTGGVATACERVRRGLVPAGA